MKVPIKFRGKDILNGNVLYGDLLHAKNELLILEFGTKVARTVAKNSVSQLIGYDAEGKEVYEGDMVDAFFGTATKPSHNFPAALMNNIEAPTDLDFKFVKRG